MTHANSEKDKHYLVQRKCWRKKGWRNKTDARKAAKRLYKQFHIRLYPYKCSECKEVHLTKNISVKGVSII